MNMQDVATQYIHEEDIDEARRPQRAANTLPSRWKTARLGEIAKVLYGKARPNDNGTFLVIGSGGIYGSTSRPLIEYETLVIGRKGTAGSVYYAPKPCYPSDTAFYLEWKQEICVQFLYYSLQLRGLAPDKSVIPSLQRGDIENFIVALPPLPEQRALARALQTVQDAIQARRNEIELERERKAALMQRLFMHGTRNEPTKQSEIGKMPESWEVVRLGNLCVNNLGLIQTGPFGSQLHASDYRDHGIPVVNPTHLGINTIIEDSLPLISKEDAERLSKHYLAEGDILMSRRGDFSRYSYITSRQAGWLCGTGCLLIRFNNPQVDNRFLAISIGAENVQRYLSYTAVGSIMPNLNTKILEGLPLAFPSTGDEQREIAGILSACDSKITPLEKELSLHEEFFRALLDELMTGRLSAPPLVE